MIIKEKLKIIIKTIMGFATAWKLIVDKARTLHFLKTFMGYFRMIMIDYTY